MRDLIIDMADFGGVVSAGDEVVLSAPAVRGSSVDPERIITPQPRALELVDGVVTVPVEVGPLRVTLKPKGGVLSGTTFKTVVPDGEGPITLRVCLEGQFRYDPPVVSAVGEAAVRAESSASNAALSAGSAGDAAVVAGGHADRADESAHNASVSASAAATSATNAASSATSADASKTAAAGSATDTVAAIEVFKESVDSVRWRHQAVPLDASSINELADGSWRIASSTVAINLGLPPLLGSLTVRALGSSIQTALFQSEGTTDRPSELWVASSLRNSGTWLPWRKIPGMADIPAAGVTASQLTTAVDGVRFRRENIPLSVTSLSELADGQHGVASNTVSNNLGLPGGVLGTLTIRLIGVSIRTATFQTEGVGSTPSEMWTTSSLRSTGEWLPWRRLVTEGAAHLQGQSSPVATGGLKTVPLALTLGQGAKTAPTSGHYRIPFLYTPEIARYRVGFSLRNTRSGLHQGSGVQVTATMGQHAGSGHFTTAPAIIASNMAVPDNGSAAYTRWVESDIGSGVEGLLAYAYTSTTAPYLLVGGGFSTTGASVTSLTPATARVVESPLDIWIEVEVESTVPVVGIIGDSITCGVGTSIPIYEAWGNLYTRSIGGLAVLWGMSGDTAAKWVESPTQYKITRWDHLDNPDAIVWALGRNDFSNGSTSAQVRAMTESALSWALQKSRRVYAAAITPRASGLGDAERAIHNDWLRETFSAVLPFDEAVSTPDGGLNPELHRDGLHPNTSGAAAMAGAITRPITAVRLPSV